MRTLIRTGTMLILLFVANSLSAQRSFELGFNSTNIVQNVVGLVGNSDQIIEPYTLSMRFANDKNALRFGLGGGYNTQNNQQFGSGNLNSVESLVVFSCGYEARKAIQNRFRVFYGAEFIYSSFLSDNEFNFFSQNTSFVTVTRAGEKVYNIAPFFGLHFQINDWFGVSTKSSLQFALSEKMQETLDPANGIKRGPDYTVDHYVRHVLPNSIYVYFNLDKLPNLKKE